MPQRDEFPHLDASWEAQIKCCSFIKKKTSLGAVSFCATHSFFGNAADFFSIFRIDFEDQHGGFFPDALDQRQKNGGKLSNFQKAS